MSNEKKKDYREELIKMLTADLDMLDDDTRHARCLSCTPRMGLYQPFVALCGERVMHTWAWYAEKNKMPPNPCSKCAELMTEPCPKGHGAYEKRAE